MGGLGGSASRAALKRVAKLQRKKYREAERLFLAEGPSLVAEARERPRHLFTEPEDVRRLSTLKTPTGPVGVFSFLDVSAKELLEARERVVLLHGVQDPGNVGTVIRAVHAFEAGVALSAGCADLYNPKTVRATMGSIFHVPVARELDTLEFLDESRGAGFAPVAAVPDGQDTPRTMSGDGLVLVVGSEGRGLPKEVVVACDRSVTIPSCAASLNAAMAASILLYEAYMRVLT
ncbi:MAG: RNA methyltransferase [Actinomycetota bacterium]|nr:RNA methyltransferase [Actinomycetota bacterium]